MTHQKSKYVSATAKLSLLTMALMSSPFAMAQRDNTGWYGGANIGRSGATIDETRITSGLLSKVERDRGYKIFGGYQFNKYFAAEAGYLELGKFGFTTNTVPLGTGTLNASIKLKGLNLDAVGTLPITEKFSVFGRLGVAHTQANDAFVGTGAVNVLIPNPSARNTNLKIGLGLQYALTDALMLRTEIERYRIDDAVGNKGDVDLVSVGLVYRYSAPEPDRRVDIEVTGKR
jgi:OOP family OmpA-OmpF porin